MISVLGDLARHLKRAAHGLGVWWALVPGFATSLRCVELAAG
jgi:hypothetical protein